MNISEFNSSCDKILRNMLRERNHIKTGNLYRSIKFVSTFNKSTERIMIKCQCLFYIQFLEDGRFLKDFRRSNELKALVGRFYKDRIQEMLREIILKKR